MVACLCETFVLERGDSGKVVGNNVALQMLVLVVIIENAARLQISPRVGPEEIEIEKLIILKYLIAKLHGLVGDKAVKYPL